MDIKLSDRGFGHVFFKDADGMECKMIESSISHEEYLLRIGHAKIGLKHFKSGQGWVEINEPDEVNSPDEHYDANTMMHLSQSQVKELLPFLERFVETGRLDTTEDQ